MKTLTLLMLILFLWSATSFAAPTSVIVELTEERGALTEYATVQRARARAVIEGIERLPSILIGREQLRQESGQEDAWSLDVKAVIASQAQSRILMLSWNDERSLLDVKVEVSLDYQETMAMLHGIQSSLAARGKLKELYARFIQSVESSSDLSDLSLLRAEADHVIFNYFNSLSHEDAVRIKGQKEQAEKTLQSYRDYEELLKIWNSLTVEVKDVREDAVVIDLRASYVDAPTHVTRRFCIARNKDSDDVILTGLRFINPDSRIIIRAGGEISETDELLWTNRRPPIWRRDRSEFELALASVGGERSSLPRYGFVFIANELGLNLDAILANPRLLLERVGGC